MAAAVLGLLVWLTWRRFSAIAAQAPEWGSPARIVSIRADVAGVLPLLVTAYPIALFMLLQTVNLDGGQASDVFLATGPTGGRTTYWVWARLPLCL